MALDDGRVVSNFILQSLENLPITVYGDGTQTRSFCYVDDLIDGLIKLFYSEDVFFPVNLGNPEPITMIDLAHEIIKLTKSSSKIHLMKLPEDDPTQREPSIETAARVIAWYPKISRETGLIKTIEYFSNLKNARN
jgi:UDP-glucuronate decarboxylase